MQGRSIKLFLVDGSSSGILTVEIMNWTGHLMVCPRSRLDEALKRVEAGRTGVYFLIGDEPTQAHRDRIYIGEGDVVADRIRNHANKKDFWTRACICTSKDANLTKAHVRYLESRLIEIAKSVDRVSIDNGNEPRSKQLPESDIADMEEFIAQLMLVIPTVGFDFLRAKPGAISLHQQTQESSGSGLSDSVQLTLKSEKNRVHAKAVELDGEVTVMAGATATVKSFTSNGYANRRQELIDSGLLVLSESKDCFNLTKDTLFRSPSEAAAILLNRNSNGRTEWRVTETDQTLKAWQDAKLIMIGPS